MTKRSKLLEPAAAKVPDGAAALELGLLHLRLGRTDAGTTLLTAVYQRASTGGDATTMARGARAAQAAPLPFRAASATGGGDPAIDTAWGMLFLEKYNNAEAARSFRRSRRIPELGTRPPVSAQRSPTTTHRRQRPRPTRSKSIRRSTAELLLAQLRARQLTLRCGPRTPRSHSREKPAAPGRARSHCCDVVRQR